MSSELEKDKERLIQAAKMFYFHVKDLVSFINIFTEFFNRNMNTQILSIAVKEDSKIKDFFEQMLKNFKEMQSVVEATHSKIQKEPVYSSVAKAMCSVAEKCTNAELQPSAKNMLKNVKAPVVVSMLHSSNVLGSLESSLSLLMKSPVMNLQLGDFYREDTKEQSEATTSGKTPSPNFPQTIAIDTLKKLQDSLKTENSSNHLGSAADQLEQIVKAMKPTLETLRKVRKTLETDISA